ncbi:MAG TPA: alpha/beta fold hydrolase [Terriglobales bacterium]|nr:alpha/beta fold hydrolase [Terriglobales bacterium]
MKSRFICFTILLAGLGATAVCSGALQVAQQRQPPAQSTASTVETGATYEDLGRQIVADLAARQFDKVCAQFNEAVSAALPPDKLAGTWDSLLTQAGDFVSIEKSSEKERQGFHVVRITTVFQKARLDAVIAFDAQKRVAGLHFVPAETTSAWQPPAYVKPESFHEREVTVGSSPWQLPGTLTLPNGAGPFPAVVLVHGSGPHDRDESIGPNKPFKDLAWGLAGRGIAVLRYEKRTRIYPQEMAQSGNLTVNDETVDDARKAVDLLATQPEIQAKHIFVLGHSLGGYVGPRIASGDSKIAGLIIMAGSTRPMEQMVVEQVRYLATLDGKITPEGQKQIDEAEKLKAAVEDPNLKPGMTINFLGASMPASYFLDLRGYHAPELAGSLQVPILVLQGGRDYQVSAADFDGWKKALAAQPTASFKLYPALNHLFMAGEGPSSGVEYEKPNHVLEEVVQDTAEWVRQKSQAVMTGKTGK